jgi:hypothetical protein
MKLRNCKEQKPQRKLYLQVGNIKSIGMKKQIRSRSGKNMPVNPEIIVVTDFFA